MTTYKIELPMGMLFYDIFNIDKFKLYVRNPEHFTSYTIPPAPTIIDHKIEYEVEKILDRRNAGTKKKPKIQYLIKWVRYEEPTWEPEENVTHVAEALNDYFKSIGG